MQTKKTELARPAAASISYILAAALGKAAALCTLPFFTARLGAAAYGRYALFLCYEGILFAAAAMGLGGAAVYRALQKYRGEENRLLTAAFGLSLAVSLPIYVIGAFFLRDKLSPLLIVLLLLQVTARVALTLFCAKCRFFYRYKPVCALNLLADLGAPVLGMLLLLWLPIGEQARIFSGAIFALLLGIISLVAFFQRGTHLFDKEIWRFLLSLQLPLLPHYLSVAFMAEAARLAVERTLGSEALGAYAVAHSVGLALSLISVGLGGAFQPWVLRKAASGEHARVAAAAKKIALLLCTLSFLPILLAPEIFSILAPTAYTEGLAAVPALCFTVPFSFLATIPICASLGGGQRLSISIASAAAALLELLLCPLLAARLGLFGASLGALISYAFFFLIHSFFLKKDQKSIINANNCFLIVLSFASVGMFLPILFPHFLLRVILAFLHSVSAAMQVLPMRRHILHRRRPALSS